MYNDDNPFAEENVYEDKFLAGLNEIYNLFADDDNEASITNDMIVKLLEKAYEAGGSGFLSEMTLKEYLRIKELFSIIEKNMDGLADKISDDAKAGGRILHKKIQVFEESNEFNPKEIDDLLEDLEMLDDIYDPLYGLDWKGYDDSETNEYKTAYDEVSEIAKGLSEFLDKPLNSLTRNEDLLAKPKQLNSKLKEVLPRVADVLKLEERQEFAEILKMNKDEKKANRGKFRAIISSVINKIVKFLRLERSSKKEEKREEPTSGPSSRGI
ncbi:MAG: hypothetical protein KKE11_05010 [Gammaproteobacteria bacterium]|nr:hypothetical protein [Gammaproteobacteria bacterium]